MYLFYETLPKFEFDTLMRIDSCEFRNGVDISEESSGLSMYFYNTVQDNDFTKGIAKSGIKLAVMHDQSKQAVLVRTLLRMGRNRPGNIYINTIPGIPYTTKKSSQTLECTYLIPSFMTILEVVSTLSYIWGTEILNIWCSSTNALFKET